MKDISISHKELYIIIGLFIILFFIIHSLFIVLFLTFIFSYLANSALDVFSRYQFIRLHHKFLTSIVFLLFITLIIILGVIIIPSSYRDTVSLVRHIPPTFNVIDFIKNNIMQQIPLVNRIDGQTISNFLASQDLEKINIPDITAKITSFFGSILMIFIDILVSFILSFFIILEKKELQHFFTRIEKGPIGRYYLWIKPYFVVLADSFGKTFESQAIIALINSFLCTVGLYFLGFRHLLALWFLIFIFSFIPVFGVILSSIPIMIIGFIIGGFPMVLQVLVLIIIAHFIEAYFLNPNIYASRAKLPIAIAFIALVVGEFVGGVWGLLLAIPTLYFLYNILVLGKVKWNMKS
jgi:predicted PurR-regulated permease PerM